MTPGSAPEARRRGAAEPKRRVRPRVTRDAGRRRRRQWMAGITPADAIAPRWEPHASGCWRTGLGTIGPDLGHLECSGLERAPSLREAKGSTSPSWGAGPATCRCGLPDGEGSRSALPPRMERERTTGVP